MSWWLLLALASAPGPVTLAPTTCDPALRAALRDELLAAGFSVDDAGAPIATIITRCDAPGRVFARVEDHVTRKAVERELEPGEGSRVASRAAVQVVELLHASLAEARFAALVDVPAPVERFLAAREVGPWHTELGGGVLVAPGGFGVEPAVSAALWRSQRLGGWRVSVGALVDATVRATVLRSAAGEADVGLVAARVAAATDFDLGGLLQLSPRVGVGVLLAWASGRAAASNVGSIDAVPTFTASLGLTVSRQLTDWLALGLSADVGLTPFPIVVVLPDLQATLGAPYVTVGLVVVLR
jgi:hypothetical protein